MNARESTPPADTTDRRPLAGRALRVGLVAGAAFSVLVLVSLPSFAIGDVPTALFWPAALLAPLPVCVVGWLAGGSGGRPWRTAFGVSLGSLPLWIFHHAWVADVSLAGVVPLVLYLAVWPGLGVWAVASVSRVAGACGPALAVPTVWVALEFVRGEMLFGGYAWFLAGHPMIEFPPLARASAVGGVYLVSWMVVAVSGVALAARFGRRASRVTAWVVSAGLVVGLLIGLLSYSQDHAEGAPSVTVAAVQTNVPQDNKLLPTPEQVTSDFRELVALIQEAGRGENDGVSPVLIVVPETVFPGIALDGDGAQAAAALLGSDINGFRDALLDAQRESGAALLVGSLTRAGLRTETTESTSRLAWDAVYNSVYLLSGGRVADERYDKLRPTPFGETLPYVQEVPLLRDLIIRIGVGASGMDFGLASGDRPAVFSVPSPEGPVGVASPICFESSMSAVVRALARSGSTEIDRVQLLAVLTNDGWFGSFDPGRAMHLLQGRWRCVETDLPMVRSANTGVTAVIDRHGRVVEALPLRTSGVLVSPVALGSGATVYMVIGDAVGWLCFVAGLGWTGLGVWQRRRDRRGAVPTARDSAAPGEGGTEGGQDDERA